MNEIPRCDPREKRHDPRTGSGSGEVGDLHFRRAHPDGAPVAATFNVPRPQHIECDFWLCTCRDEADNDDYFFGPLVRA